MPHASNIDGGPGYAASATRLRKRKTVLNGYGRVRCKHACRCVLPYALRDDFGFWQTVSRPRSLQHRRDRREQRNAFSAADSSWTTRRMILAQRWTFMTRWRLAIQHQRNHDAVMRQRMLGGQRAFITPSAPHAPLPLHGCLPIALRAVCCLRCCRR